MRLIQVFLPSAQREALHALILDHAIQETWEDLVSEDRVLTQMLASTHLVGGKSGQEGNTECDSHLG